VDDPSAPGATEAEHWVRPRIVEIAEENFPDDLGLEWRIHGVRQRGGLLFVEVEPIPAQVGYPRFLFTFTYTDLPAPSHVATYCLEAGRYSLLSTAPEARELPRFLAAQ